MIKPPNQYLDITPSIRLARTQKIPIVALESTIITHGMPYPQNLEVANNVEKIIRSEGAEPATIAILAGRIKVGLTSQELKYLAAQGHKVNKVSRRDLPYIIAQKMDGATTVAATMIAAQMADIQIFATGGIGGVHLGAEDTMDISADLQELANTNVAVVCAGAKAILDLALTLQYLETSGVPVVGYGTDEFPAFYTRSSGLPVDFRYDSTKEIAAFLKTKWDLDLKGGIVIANPIPEAYSMDFKKVKSVVERAISEANNEGVQGKDLTPYLLSKIEDITGGQSLKSNIELVYNNARLAAGIAKELCVL